MSLRNILARKYREKCHQGTFLQGSTNIRRQSIYISRFSCPLQIEGNENNDDNHETLCGKLFYQFKKMVNELHYLTSYWTTPVPTMGEFQETP